jgi:copper resistance protein C
MLSRRLAVAVTIVLVFALAVVAIAPAFAAAPQAVPTHAALVASGPADGSTVERADQVVLEFNEVVNPSFVAVRVAGPGGGEAEGAPVVEGRQVTQALTADVPAGQHTVTYRVVSADGHPISGTITFTTTTTTEGLAESPSASASATTGATPSSSATAEPTTAAPATASSDGGSPSWLVPALGVILLGALTIGAWRLRTTRHSGAS